MNDLSIILCSYNEEKNIEKTIKKLLKYRVVKEIIIIDDYSKDKTKIQGNGKYTFKDKFDNFP